MGVSNQTIENIIQNMVASNKNMPISLPNHICQVTEIIIRVGPPEGLRTINPLITSLPCPICCCCPPPKCGPSVANPSIVLDDETTNLFNRICDVTGYKPEKLLQELLKFK
jgi:hypothetical protein